MNATPISENHYLIYGKEFLAEDTDVFKVTSRVLIYCAIKKCRKELRNDVKKLLQNQMQKSSRFILSRTTKMKSKIFLIAVIGALAVGGTIFGFTYKKDGTLAGSKECKEYQNCPKKGQEDCPIIANCPKKGTDECPYKDGDNVPECCKKKH